MIARALDDLGVDYIEGGWPGANPTDNAFFAALPKTKATITAFGMTKRAGRSAENDDVLAAVLNAGTSSVCLVGKTHDFHVETALGISLGENIDAIRLSIAHIVAQGREAIFDAEHFFDGYKSNPAFALESLKAALGAGARWLVLCDTNGGALPREIYEIVSEVIASGIPGKNLGIHTHNDTENAVANSLVAVAAGARQIQGTLNGLGERCGNANLTTIIPTLLLKEPFASQFETGVTREGLTGLLRASRMLDEILNHVPHKQAAYVGASAFAHKAGLHASAIAKANAINAASGHNITASANENTVTGAAATAYTAITAGDLTINGVSAGAVGAENGDATAPAATRPTGAAGPTATVTTAAAATAAVTTATAAAIIAFPGDPTITATTTAGAPGGGG